MRNKSKKRSKRVPNLRKKNIVSRICEKLSISAYNVFERAYRYVHDRFDLRQVKKAYGEYKSNRTIPSFVRRYGSHVFNPQPAH